MITLVTCLGLTSCGQVHIDRFLHKTAKARVCVLPFQNPSTHTIDRTLDFLTCFHEHPQLVEVNKILSTWNQRLGKDVMDSFLSPLEAVVSDPAFFRYVLNLLKDPNFPTHIAPFVRSLDSFLNSALGEWGIELIRNGLDEFQKDLQGVLQRELQDPTERRLWLSSLYTLMTELSVTLSTYTLPGPEAAGAWNKIEKDFWVNLLTHTQSATVREWIWKKHRALLDYLWTQGPHYFMLDLLLKGYPNSLIQSFAQNAWLLKSAGRSGNVNQQHFTDYIDTHIDVLFNPDWTLDETKLILSRSTPITFQLFQANLPNMAELEFTRTLNRNLLSLEGEGVLYQFIQFVQILFNLDQKLFWDAMGAMCDDPRWAAGRCGIFQAVSYVWSSSPGGYLLRHMRPVSNFVKSKLLWVEEDEEFKGRMTKIFPAIPDPNAWVDAFLALNQELLPSILDIAKKFSEGREQVHAGSVPEVDALFLKDLDQFVGRIASSPSTQQLAASINSIIHQPEFKTLITHLGGFLISQGAGEILSQTAILGERFLGEIPTFDMNSAASFSIQDSLPPKRQRRVDWYEIMPPTVSQKWELGVVRYALDHPSRKTSNEWSQMGGINTLYFMFLPDYLVRERFDAIQGLLWISSLADYFDFPKTLDVLPRSPSVNAIPKEVDFGSDFFGPHEEDPFKRFLWRLNVRGIGTPPESQPTMAQVLIRRLRERLKNVKNLDAILTRMATEQAFMGLHPDREIKVMKDMTALLDSRAACKSKIPQDIPENDVCHVYHALQGYLDQWSQENGQMSPYQLKVSPADASQESIFEQMENILLLNSHSFNLDIHRRLTVDAYVPINSGLPAPELSNEGALMTMAMRILGESGVYHDDMAMHFFVNYVNNTDGGWQQIYRLVNRVLFDEFTGTVLQDLNNFVDIKAQFKSPLHKGIQYPSGRVLCFEYHICGFPTELSVLTALARFAVFKYMAEPMDSDQSLFSIFHPFFMDVASFTVPEYRLSHSWHHNHLAFFTDFARTGAFRAVRPFILHLAQTGDLKKAIQLLDIYLSGYEKSEDFKDLELTLQLLQDKLPLAKRLLEKLPSFEGINPVYVLDALWITFITATEALDTLKPITAPQVDRWVAAILSVLDENMIDRVAELTHVLSPPLREVVGAIRYLRVVGEKHEVLKILTKIFFNISVMEEVANPRTFEERQKLIRDTIAQLPEWTKEIKKMVAGRSWARVPHDNPRRDAQWLMHRSSRLANYLKKLFYPRGTQH